MRCAIYVRVSTEEQKTHGLSLDFQRETCTAAALRAGFAAVEVFEDAGFSATSLKRPALAALRAHLADYETVYVWKLDRLSRSVGNFADLMEEFAGAGCGFVSVTEGVDFSGAAGRLMMYMLAAVAAFFADLNRERTKAGLAHRATALRLPSGSAPYAYRAVGRELPYEPEPAEVPVVQEMFARYAAGDTLASLTRWLNASGIPTHRGGRLWRERTVKQILANPTYAGDLPRLGASFPGGQEALVEPATWQAVQTRLALGRSIPPQSRRASLAPLLTCGLCGQAMIRSGQTAPGNPSPRVAGYTCAYRRQQPLDQRHPSGWVSALAVEEALWRYTRQYLGGTLQAGLARAAQRQREEAQREDLAALRRRVASLDRQLAGALRGYSLGNIPEAVYAGLVGPLGEERVRLAARLEELQPSAELHDLALWAKAVKPAAAVATARTYPADLQVQFLRRLYRRVEVYGRRLVESNVSA